MVNKKVITLTFTPFPPDNFGIPPQGKEPIEVTGILIFGENSV